MSGRKRKSKDTDLDVNEGDEGISTKSKAKKPKTLDPKKFGGMSEEEVMKLTLPDHLKPNLDIIFVSRYFNISLYLSIFKIQIGINPGLYSAYIGHHYSNANNHFCKCMYCHHNDLPIKCEVWWLAWMFLGPYYDYQKVFTALNFNNDL